MASNPSAAPIVVRPADLWLRSTVTAETLLQLVEDGLLRLADDHERPEWIMSDGDDDEPHPPVGYVVSFVAFHE